MAIKPPVLLNLNFQQPAAAFGSPLLQLPYLLEGNQCAETSMANLCEK